MTKIKAAFLGAVLALAGIAPAHADIDALDNVPAATLLLPYFEVDPAANGIRTVFTVGNVSASEQLAHVTLWTDRGVPTYSFDIRLPAYGVSEVDLRALFVSGTLPQSTPGGFATCAATLPPATLSGPQITGLQNAHTGQASTLLGGMCGGVARGDGRIRGYATIDVTSACTSLVPGDIGYFVAGGTGIARNSNVLWGEYSTTNPAAGSSYGDALVPLEADAANALTNGAGDYTFYGRRVAGTGADNREALPQQWMGRHSFQDTILHTTALIWRDPGDVDPFACAAPPAGLTQTDIVAFDHQENPSGLRRSVTVPYATQSLRLDDPSQAQVPFPLGFTYYDMRLGTAAAPFGANNQAHVSHVYESIFGTSGQATVWSLFPMSNSPTTLPVSFADCSDGIDNDSDGQTDFPADTGCQSASSLSESPQCSDGISNDTDGLIDFPNDPGCASAFSNVEAPQCDDGIDNDSNLDIDFPNDPECTSRSDPFETANPQCSDGIDNDNDGQTDYAPGAGGDTDCGSISDNTEAGGICSDGIDNDGDTFIDFPADTGCQSRFSNTEAPVCRDGVDNDGDLLTDFPNDPGCVSAFSNTEAPQCNDGISNDADGLVDFPADPGCASASSNNEAPMCNDGIDNDGNLDIDFPNDPECLSASGTSEFSPSGGGSQCNDGIDNDGDLLIDFPNETGCTTASDPFEGPDCAVADPDDNDLDGLSNFGSDPGCASATDLNELSNALTRGCSDGIDNDNDGATDYPADTSCESAWDDVEFSPSGAAPIISVAPSTLPNANGGVAYTQTFTASGGVAPYTFTLSAGTLPTGLSLASNGTLSGTPTQGGTFNFTVQATDANLFTGTVAVALTVALPTITVSPSSLPPASGGVAYSQTFTASGGTGPYAFALATGTLPVGLTLAANGTLSGTPTQGGTFNFTVRATDANAFTGTVAVALVVAAPMITVNPPSLPGATSGVTYAQTLTATGGTGPYTFTLAAGSLPPGLTLAANGTLSGIPTAAGTFNFTVQATDANAFTGTRAYGLSVSPVLIVPTLSLWSLALLLAMVGIGSWFAFRRP